MMKNFIATNTSGIKEDRARCCRAHKEICCLKKTLLLQCCALSLFCPHGSGVSRHKFGLPRRAEQGSSSFHFSVVVTLPVSVPHGLSPCNPSCFTPTAITLIKTSQHLPGFLLQEVAPWRTMGKGSVVYGMLLEENPHVWNLCALVQGLFLLLECNVI